MAHFKVEQRSLGSLTSEFVHDPESNAQSIQDYLEDKFGEGWEFVGASDAANGPYWVFKANAQ